MSELNEAIEVATTVDQAWKLLSDYKSAHLYVPNLVASKMAGMTRVCVTTDGHEIHERISDESAETHSFRYEHVKTPMPVKLSRGRFSVSPTTTGCEIRIQAELVAASPEMQAQLRDMMRGGLRATLENLRRLLQDQAPPRTMTT
jgi:hypothetical protein